MRRGTIIPIVALLFAFPAIAADHYVYQGATGTGSGADWANACTDFTGACAVNNLVRGDTYYVAAGSYSLGGINWNTPTNGSSVITIKRATRADHGTDANWNDAYDGRVSWGLWRISTSDWTFEGQTGRSVPSAEAEPYGFLISNNFTSGDALLVIAAASGADHIVLSHIEITGVQCCTADYANGPYGIHYSGQGLISDGNTFQYLSIHDVKSDPIHVSDVTNFVLDHVFIARNEGLLSDNHGQGIWMERWNGATIRYSFLQDVVGTAQIVCGSGASGNYPCRNIDIYGNVFYHTRTHPQSSNGNVSGNESTHLIECINPENPCYGLKFYNNTIANFDDYHADFYPGADDQVVAENNLWYNIDGSHGESGSYSIYLYQAGSHIHDFNTFQNVSVPTNFTLQAHEWITTAGSANPFSGMSGQDFRLTSDSVEPHLGDGAPLSPPYDRDPDGNTRGADGTWNRGAYESEATVTATPTFSPPGGTYNGPQSVSLSDATPGAVIYYTTDGSSPTTSSTRYNNELIQVTQTLTIRAMAIADGFEDSVVATATYAFRVATPTFSPVSGAYSEPLSVSISDATAGAAIYYTTDGSIPTISSTQYAGPISVSQTTTIKAFGTLQDYADSDVATATYSFQAAKPNFDPAGGTYNVPLSVSISDVTPGAVIYYTTDGSSPTTSSAMYTNPVQIAQSTTIKAMAVAPGWSSSAVSTATYTLQAVTPTFSPAGGTYNSPLSVTITDATPGVTIYYTTNGSIPKTSSSVYTGPITVTKTTTIKAMTAAPGWSSSAVAAATYTFRVAAPTFSPAAGTYIGPLSVTVADGTPGATIYYTTDGKTPKTSSNIYTGPIPVTKTTTIKAMAALTGWTNSTVASAKYTIR